MSGEVEVLPADMRFRFQLGKQLLATITINNPHDRRLAFKIKTTAPKKYVVRPSSGITEPRASVNVQVIMQAQKEYPPDFQNCKDKFMVQTTTLADDEQLDKDTFAKEGRKDLKEARLRVILEGPAAPPSPVPEVNENEEDLGRAEAAAALGAPQDSRMKNTLSDLSNVSSENATLKSTVDKLTRERDELRRRADMLELQSGGVVNRAAASTAVGQDPAVKFRVTIIHIILAAILAFLIGHYT